MKREKTKEKDVTLFFWCNRYENEVPRLRHDRLFLTSRANRCVRASACGCHRVWYFYDIFPLLFSYFFFSPFGLVYHFFNFFLFLRFGYSITMGLVVVGFTRFTPGRALNLSLACFLSTGRGMTDHCDARSAVAVSFSLSLFFFLYRKIIRG